MSTLVKYSKNKRCTNDGSFGAGKAAGRAAVAAFCTAFNWKGMRGGKDCHFNGMTVWRSVVEGEC